MRDSVDIITEMWYFKSCMARGFSGLKGSILSFSDSYLTENIFKGPLG